MRQDALPELVRFFSLLLSKRVARRMVGERINMRNIRAHAEGEAGVWNTDPPFRSRSWIRGIVGLNRNPGLETNDSGLGRKAPASQPEAF